MCDSPCNQVSRQVAGRRYAAGRCGSALMYQRRHAYRAAASWPLELLEEVIRQGPVEVGRNGELAGTQTKGARLGSSGEQGADFRERPPATDDEERFARLDALEEGERVALDILHADGTHAIILTEGGGRTVHYHSRVTP